MVLYRINGHPPPCVDILTILYHHCRIPANKNTATKRPIRTLSTILSVRRLIEYKKVRNESIDRTIIPIQYHKIPHQTTSRNTRQKIVTT